MHAHRISVLSNIQFKLSLIYILRLNNWYFTGEFFSLQRAFMHRSAGVITQVIPVSCMLCSKALSLLFPLSLQRWVGVLHTADSDFPSLNSLIQMGSIGGSHSRRTTAAVLCPRVWKVPAPRPCSHCSFRCGKWPASSLSQAFPHVPVTRPKNSASFLHKALWCVLFLSDLGAWEQ